MKATVTTKKSEFGTVAVVDIDYGWSDIVKMVSASGKKPIWAEVGIFDGVTPATVGKGTGTARDSALIAEYATYLEYGTVHIKPYRWMRSVVEATMGEYSRAMEEATWRYIQGLLTSSQALLPIATRMQRDFRKSITEKGLIDTGAMRSAVDYRLSTEGTRNRGD